MIFLLFCIASLPQLGRDTQKTRSQCTLIGRNKTAFYWLLGVIGAQESAFNMFVGVQVAVEGEGWMFRALDK